MPWKASSVMEELVVRRATLCPDARMPVIGGAVVMFNEPMCSNVRDQCDATTSYSPLSHEFAFFDRDHLGARDAVELDRLTRRPGQGVLVVARLV
jgi:hypothetical protein